jgi:predicted secreted protein
LLPETNGAQVFQVEAFGSWKVIYQRQGELGGVFDAADAEKSRQFVEKYLAGQIQ